MDWDTAVFYAVNGWAGQSAALDWLMLQCSSAGNLILLIVAFLAWRAWLDWRQGHSGHDAALGVSIGARGFPRDANQVLDCPSAAVSRFAERP